MSAHQPLVSVCIPAYNCEQYIQQTLNCLCAQNHLNIELIMVNDGSTDRTLALSESVNDARLRIISVPNGGAAKARNIAYQHAQGEYIIFFDADDYIQPDFISQQISQLNNRTDVVVLSGWGRFYNNDLSTFKADHTPEGEITFEEWINLYWYNCNPMTNPGRALIPTTIIEKAGLWNEELSLNDDLEFFTRIFLNSRAIVFNTDAVFYYRSGLAGSLSDTKHRKAVLSAFHSIDQATGNLLTVNHSPAAIAACANIWQGFIYDHYPNQPDLMKAAQEKIDTLGGSSLAFHAGGITKIMVAVIGWKATKQLKNIIKNK